MQAPRIDIDQQRAKSGDAVADRPAADVSSRAQLGVLAGRRPFGLAGDRERRTRQVLHDPVVQGRGDAAPLLRRGVQRPPDQVFALKLGPACARDDEPHQRDEQQNESRHTAEHDAGETAPQFVASLATVS